MAVIRVAYYIQASHWSEVNPILKKMKELTIAYTDRQKVFLTSEQYEDVGYTPNTTEAMVGFDSKNFEALLKRIRDKALDLVVIQSLDILGKSLKQVGDILELFRIHGVSVLPLEQSNLLVANSRSTQLELGFKRRTKVPYGYKIINGRIIADFDPNTPKNLPLNKRLPGNVVLWIFHHYIKIKSFAGIANKLNRHKVFTPESLFHSYSASGILNTSWSRQQVKNVLSNKFYAGLTYDQRDYVPLVAIDLFEKASDHLKSIPKIRDL